MGTVELSVTLLARRVQFNARESGQYVIILPAQTLKKYKLEHGSTMVLLDAKKQKQICVKLHNAVEYGVEYSFLKPTKAMASEELILSLDAETNTPITLKLTPLGEVPAATTLTMTYLEHYDTKGGEWKRICNQKQVDDLGNHKQATDPGARYLDWTGSTVAGEAICPPSKWWYALLNRDMTPIIVNSMIGAILAPGNVVALNLKGVLARFKCIDVEAKGNKRVNGDIGRVIESTEVAIKLVSNNISSHNAPRKNKVNKLGGLTEPIGILKRHVIYPLVYADKYAQLGIFPPTGVLLHGPPGCGKTMIAKAMREDFAELFGLAENTSVYIKLVQSSDIISSLVGRTEENINALFAECEEIAQTKPCICFIDEIDVLCRKRDGSTEFNTRNVTALLNNLDGVGSQQSTPSRRKGYIIIGSTNDVDSMDIALRRPGRFDLEIEVGVPTASERLDILNTMLQDVKHSLNYSDIAYINDYCQAFVGADLKQLVSNASWARLNKMRNRNDHCDTASIDKYTGNSSQGISETNSDGEEEPTTLEEQCITLEDFKEALKLTRPSALRELHVHITDVLWEHIGGYEDVKLLLKECVEYPRIYSALYEKMRVQTPRGLLLYGPPGCSKTLMAKAVATESHMNFISVKGPELFSKWVGESERAIRQLFRKARTNAPCVIFFDEMDSISVSRELSDAGGVGSRVLSQLLNEMDGINSVKQVLVIGATNRPDLMDTALLRPGRLDRLVYIPLPDMEARRSIFNIYLARLPTDGFSIEQASEEFAKETNGYSGAEIAMICKEGAMIALREFIKRDMESRKEAATRTTNNAEDPMAKLGDELAAIKLNDIVPVSIKHIKDAMARVKPRTKPETIRFYEEYRAQHPF